MQNQGFSLNKKKLSKKENVFKHRNLVVPFTSNALIFLGWVNPIILFLDAIQEAKRFREAYFLAVACDGLTIFFTPGFTWGCILYHFNKIRGVGLKLNEAFMVLNFSFLDTDYKAIHLKIDIQFVPNKSPLFFSKNFLAPFFPIYFPILFIKNRFSNVSIGEHTNTDMPGCYWRRRYWSRIPAACVFGLSDPPHVTY